MKLRPAMLCASVLIALLPAVVAQAQDWPEVFDPLQLLALNLEMDQGDWQTVQNDESLSIEVPALFWAGSEAQILVSVRRKSATPLNNGGGFTKVSLKIDINEYVPGQMWHSLRKLSLENGDDQDVVSEGLAWNLHRFAGGPEGYGYSAGLGSWVTLNINGTDTGVYVNAEQRDKRFLQNRGLHTPGETWLYKVSDINGLEIKVGGPEHSPTVQTLCYSPFAAANGECPTPPGGVLAAELPSLINMQGMLSLGAVNSFVGNPDAIFSHGKNFYFADFLTTHIRMHFPWDQDSVLTGQNEDIYATGSPYSEILLAVPEFRAQYSQIMNDLICGPLSLGSIITFLNALEPILTDPLAADPNNQIEGTVAEHFNGLRNWVTNRVTEVAAQIEDYEECPAGCDDGNFCTDDTGDPKAGCMHTPNYDPGSECCNPTTGGTTPVDDDNACTDDACNPDTGQVSHIDNFDPATECCDPATGDITPIDDNDACTDDVCDAGTGQVTHTPVVCPKGRVCDPETGECASDSECGPCPTDINGDGNTGPADLAALLGSWGTCEIDSPCECLDANADGAIGPLDLATLLGAWGPCI